MSTQLSLVLDKLPFPATQMSQARRYIMSNETEDFPLSRVVGNWGHPPVLLSYGVSSYTSTRIDVSAEINGYGSWIRARLWYGTSSLISNASAGDWIQGIGNQATGIFTASVFASGLESNTLYYLWVEYVEGYGNSSRFSPRFTETTDGSGGGSGSGSGSG